ncbi:miltefosine transporter beta subunit [Trypanosoma conorhini]|uniref:Miltefosine transporter beta subunit n=1 Tax=Trypanosoma conorhini TaxID=83891 RepID=A0A3R7KDZ6_9TRYP|nr:miltefosine transporter beta subunit [Trypanosoma conorhini]RNF04625.1 miltefosine transporter beta subunit [Trypanosoma conorhini]
MSNSTEQSVKKPETNNRFERFYLGQYPRHSIGPVFVTLLVLAVVFIPIGVAVIKASDSVFELRIRYDETNKYQYQVGPADRYPHKFTFNNSNFSTGAYVNRTFSLSKSLASPIYLQYELVGFYQNYRRYAFSQDLAQRAGDTHSVSQACRPFRHPGEYQKREVVGIYFPCGAVAWSMFNDSLNLYQLPDASKSNTASKVIDGSKLICAGGAFDAKGNSLNKNNLCIKKELHYLVMCGCITPQSLVKPMARFGGLVEILLHMIHTKKMDITMKNPDIRYLQLLMRIILCGPLYHLWRISPKNTALLRLT